MVYPLCSHEATRGRHKWHLHWSLAGQKLLFIMRMLQTLAHSLAPLFMPVQVTNSYFS